MKIGIYGGSFNPIHLGHEQIARLVVRELNLDKLLVIPVGIPSHREDEHANSLFRLELCKKVFEEDEKIEVSDIEIRRKKTSYTYDTLLELLDIYGKENEFFEIIGEDSLENFKTWKNYKEILELSKLVVLKRKNYNGAIFDEKHKNIIYLENPYFDFSSTEIRKRLKNGEDISELVNPKIKNILLEQSS
ncbi:MAG: nicotinate (nicotinamide) nucleotide adenylyltransferase [Fusobacterium sp.]|uniref:nicotinate (nicotinamide) nucleotide adenylyltransferase n=1 Tax=Fusobacterium sp. TaxID=68766 RepID=UPI0026DC30E6|nr:nicotinate (nicotinamide) nucleotide adenylyltransferase [Fusobacterium sp.]MDO4690863.1 nicotinate (nicotinamide) nucleotide adenylyltransferase [Fusobacterium sp.]